jgi:hypothetical protein
MNFVPLDIEFWQRIQEFDHILISGCGGGYDFTQGIPLYFALRGIGKTVYWGNMTFSDITSANGEVLIRESNPGQAIVCMAITADTTLGRNDTYFPEKYLCEWFREEIKEEIVVYTFRKRGINKLTEAYNLIIERNKIQAIILIDGGSDSLMAGDEKELGTPLEDMLSIFAVKATRIESFLVCIGIGADRFHGVSDCSTLRAIAELTELGGFYGSIGLSSTMPEVQGYFEACEYIQNKMPSKSIVGHFVKSSIMGEFGNYNTLDRTANQKLFVNPLMSQYYFFNLSTVARRVKYRDFCEDTRSATDFMVGLNHYRENLTMIRIEEIPRTNEF